MEKSHASLGLAGQQKQKKNLCLRGEKEISGAYGEMKGHSTGQMKLCENKAIDLEAKGILFSNQSSSREWIFEN